MTGTSAVRLTGRGGALVIFGASLAGLLVAGWSGWEGLPGAVFFMASSLAAYHVRPRSLLPVVVSPPTLYLMASLIAAGLMSPGPRACFGATLTALAAAAWWMLAAMGLTLAIAIPRGLPAELAALWLELRRPLPCDGGPWPTCEAPGGAGRSSSP
jgi:hypothetical protein